MAWTKRQGPGFTHAQRRTILTRATSCECAGCTACQHGGCTRPGTEADHKLNRATAERLGINPNTLDNGQALCAECHWTKTRGESEAARERTYAKLKHPSAR